MARVTKQRVRGSRRFSSARRRRATHSCAAGGDSARHGCAFLRRAGQQTTQLCAVRVPEFVLGRR
jgi:hypothetical protein